MLRSKFWHIFKTQIFGIFLLGLIIRFLYLFMDYPFVLHPDEPTVVNSTINLRFDVNPKHFDWPTFYYYFTYPFFYLFEKIFFKLYFWGIIDTNVIDQYYYYILSRIVTCFFGAGTLIFVYLILKNLEVKKELCLLGACIMAILPFHVTRSAQALIDVPMVFFCSVVLYFVSKDLNQFKASNFVGACFFGGLAVSTKYNAYLIFLTLVLYIFYIKGFSMKDFSLYFRAILASFLGFFLGTPYAVLDYKTFLISDGPKGALWQFQNVGKVSILDQFNNLFQNTFISNNLLMGYLPLYLSLIFIIWFLYKKDFLKSELRIKFITIFVIQFIYIYWAVSGGKRQEAHYLLLIYLYLPIFVVLLIEKLKLDFKFTILTYFFILVTCTYGLAIRLNDVALITFYKNIKITGNPKDYLILWNNWDVPIVLDKLQLPMKKFNKSTYGLTRATHVVSNYDICIDYSGSCIYKLIAKIDSISDPEKIYVFEKK